MGEIAKFEDTERKIAKAENALLELDKFVGVDFAEDDMYHLEEHERVQITWQQRCTFNLIKDM